MEQDVPEPRERHSTGDTDQEMDVSRNSAKTDPSHLPNYATRFTSS